MTQETFSTTWNNFKTDAEAMAARDARYRELKASGLRVKRCVLKNQLRPYISFGVPDGRICDVYMLNIFE